MSEEFNKFIKIAEKKRLINEAVDAILRYYNQRDLDSFSIQNNRNEIENDRYLYNLINEEPPDIKDLLMNTIVENYESSEYIKKKLNS